MSQLVEDLKAAKALIDTPDKWTAAVRPEVTTFGGYSRVNANGAVTMALSGAHGSNFKERLEAVHAALSKQLPAGLLLSDYNGLPTTTHTDIMALFDRAIKAAEAA